MAVKAALALPVKPEKEEQHTEIPQALIQKRGMDVDGRAVRRGQAHAAEDVCLGAEGLTVHKVSPAADDLPEQKTAAQIVHHGQDGDLFAAADQPDRENAPDHAAVDSDAAVPDCKELVRVL